MMRLLVATLDWPPVWTLLALAAAWGLDHVAPFALFGPLGQVAGGALAAVGFGLMGLAVAQMALARTTLVPALMSVITVRFIEGEETRLRDHYGTAFDAYARRTRRWL